MPEETCRYVSIKIDEDILSIAKAAAALERVPLQEWVSNMLNIVASQRLGQKVVKRKPAPEKKR